MAKRSFAVDTTSLSTEKPVLDNGTYAGVIRNAGTKMGQNETINVVEEEQWDKGTRTWNKTGKYIVGGRNCSFRYGVTLTSKKAIQVLQRDEPVVFGGQINLSFNDDFKLNDNHILGQFLQNLGLHEVNFAESVDWEWDDNIEVPEELANVPDIVDMLNSVAYHRALFEVIANTVNGMPVLASIVKQPNYKTPEVLENTINCGSGNARFCGILPYVEGSEEDLEG